MRGMTQTDGFINLDDLPLVEIAARIRDEYGVEPTLRDIVSYHEIIDRAREEFGVEFELNTVRQWKSQWVAWRRKGRPARREYEQAIPDPITTRNKTVYLWFWPAVREWLIKTRRVICLECGKPLELKSNRRGLCDECRRGAAVRRTPLEPGSEASES